MRRALSLGLSAILAVVSIVMSSPQPASAEGTVRPHTGVEKCAEGSTGLATIPSTAQEAAYNDYLTVCDWGLSWRTSDQLDQFSFTNDSPVVWWFYDSVQRDAQRNYLVPQSSLLRYYRVGITPMFRQFALTTGSAGTAWLVSPGETVWLSSVRNVSFTPASSRLTSEWLFYKLQSDKIAKLGTAYAKRIATTGYESKTRTFLWNCTAAAITVRNALRGNPEDDPRIRASSWMNAASGGSQCTDSFKDLFRKELKKHPVMTSSAEKWFSTTNLDKASGFVDDIKVSGETLATVAGIFHVRL